MIDFKTFLHKSDILKEYLTPKQEKKFASLEMTPHARKNTDHFFGVGNDRKVEDIKNYEHDKSEIHQKVESHLGQKISHDEYKSGIVKDKYGRDAKLGRIIKDNSLRNEFASDPSRSGSKAIKKPYMSVVRGAHVMGQTNPESDAIHPTGHSWKDESCKNVETGINKKFLNQEVKHGSVVVFGHDHDGKEIYRATLQPHHNDLGHVAYSVDGQYGIKHPNFVAHAHDVAKRLTGEHKGGSLVYTKNPNVYDDTGKKDIMHPMATPEHISKALNDKDAKVREMAIQHPNITAEHISKALNDKEGRVREIAIQNPNATPEHISKALNDKSKHMRFAAIKNPNATPEHITKALNDNHSDVRVAAMNHPNATPEHISKALNDKDANVRTMAIYHPKATAEHITTALNDKDKGVRLWAIKHQNATAEHISKALNDKDIGVRLGAIKNPNATAEHITKALNDKEATVRDEAKAARKK